jgi:hypothetical protein
MIRRDESFSDATKRCEPDSWYDIDVVGALPRLTKPILGPGSEEKSMVDKDSLEFEVD